jgi:hypothetical protein
MQFPAQLVKLLLQARHIDIQLPGHPEKRKVIYRQGRLHFSACMAEMSGAHVAA